MCLGGLRNLYYEGIEGRKELSLIFLSAPDYSCEIVRGRPAGRLLQMGSCLSPLLWTAL